MVRRKFGEQTSRILEFKPEGLDFYIIERTSNNTYIVRKKGGRTRKAHVNRLRYYDPTNSPNDPQVQITVEDDVEEIEQNKPSIKQDKFYEGRITRSRTKDLNRITSAEH